MRPSDGCAIRDLDELLRSLTVRQRAGRWAMVSGVTVPGEVEVIATVIEGEGTTSVIPVEDAERLGSEVDFVAAWLTLEVRSALDAVGLTAAVASALAAQDIPCNVIAGFHHDHLLVPYELAGSAMAAIDDLRVSSTRSIGHPPPP